MKSIFWRIGIISIGALMANCTGACCDQLWRFNPCGTILSVNICTPAEWYGRVFNGPNWKIDPTCPIPNQCG